MTNSRYKLVEAKTRAESDSIVDLAWKAYHDPYEPAARMFHPVFGHSAADIEIAIKNDKERAWNNHTSNPKSHWLYVLDTQTGETVGGAQWLIHKEIPWPDGIPKLEATWWPEGEGREFVSQALRQVYAPRMQWCNRPHLALNQTSVHPEHRGKGVGSMLMEWGVGKADELNLESFIEASDLGRRLYEKFGYRTLFKISFSPEKKNPSQEWKRLTFELSPWHFYPTWRPAGGVFEDGKPQAPWQVDQVQAQAGSVVKMPAVFLRSD